MRTHTQPDGPRLGQQLRRTERKHLLFHVAFTRQVRPRGRLGWGRPSLYSRSLAQNLGGPRAYYSGLRLPVVRFSRRIPCIDPRSPEDVYEREAATRKTKLEPFGFIFFCL